MILWINKTLALAIHDRQLAEHGGGSGVRDEALLDSALTRPQQLHAYGDPPPDLVELAASLAFEGEDGIRVAAEFDWRQQGGEIWRIAVETDDGHLHLDSGGANLSIDGAAQAVEGPGEYPGLYARFAELIATGASDVDDAPLVHVADACMLGRHIRVEPFHD